MSDYSYQSMFGSATACSCAHCRSILGPAAYFVDVLLFLQTGERALLLAADPPRRPDLGELELSCVNTDTPLPYLDLVNEVLEYATAPGSPPAPPAKGWPQTRGSGPELLANPEHLHGPAYAKLAAALHPLGLPFDLWSEEVRVWLGQLGVGRAELMRAFAGASPDADAEELGLTPAERRVVTARLTDLAARAATTADETLAGTRTVDGVALGAGDRVLAKHQTDAAQNGVYVVVDPGPWTVVSLDEGALVTVAEGGQKGTRWALVTKPPLGPTTPRTFLPFAGAGLLDTAAHADWEPWYPDFIAAADPQTGLDAIGRRVHVLLARAGISFAELEQLVGTRYLNPDATNPWEITFLDDSCDVLEARFRRRTDPLDPLQFTPLDLPFLRRLHRFERLRRKLGWTPGELDSAVSALAAVDLTSDLLAALGVVARLRAELSFPLPIALSLFAPIDTHAAGEEASLYDRLFRNRSVLTLESGDPFVLAAGGALVTPGKISDHVPALLAALGLDARELDDIIGELGGSDDITVANLSRLHRVAALARALRLAPGELLRLRALSGIDPFHPGTAWDFVLAARRLAAAGLSVADLDYLLATGAHPDDGEAGLPAALRELQVGLAKVATDTAHAAAPTTELERLGAALVVGKLGPALGLDLGITRVFLDGGVHVVGGPDPAMSAFLDPAFVGGLAPTTTALATAHRLARAAFLVARLRITPERLGTAATPDWLLSRGRALGWLDLDTLPASGVDAQRYRGLIRLLDFLEQPLFDVLDAPDATTLRARLAAATGWPLADVTALTAGWVHPRDFADEGFLVRLRRCFDLLGRLGVAAAQVAGWLSGTGEAFALGARQAVKARFDDDAWPVVVRPLRDRLRVRQRDALVAWLTGGRSFRDANHLYEHFLLDPLTGPEVITSRLKQAISSVQLFVHRAVMNLEPGTAVTGDRARQWLEFRKNYRVWEASRKIFLYPENWLESGLRKHKTPLYRDLERQLLQKEITAEAVEDAYRRYLDGLDDIGRLDIVALFRHDPGTEQERGDDTLHVVGRTYNLPHVHYHRFRRDGVWSPWEKIDADIAGDHVFPVVFQRRLFLFWPIFEEKPDQRRMDGWENGSHLEIALAWSEYRSSRWLPKKTSHGVRGRLSVSLVEGPAMEDHTPFVFKTETDEDTLTVKVAWTDPDDDQGLQITAWTMTGSNGEPQLSPYHLSIFTDLIVPEGAEIRQQQFAQVAMFPAELRLQGEDGQQRTVLGNTPTPYRLAYPHQAFQFEAQDSFFYQDTQRTYLAEYLREIEIAGIEFLDIFSIPLMVAALPHWDEKLIAGIHLIDDLAVAGGGNP